MPATTSWPPASAHTVREFVATAFGHVGIDDWSAYVATDPDLVRPADPTDLTGDADPGSHVTRLEPDGGVRGAGRSDG